MTDVTEFPYFIIEANELAKWLESQENSWWNVDGDTKLMSKLSFPCTSWELAAELRRVKSEMHAYDWRGDSETVGRTITGEKFAGLANTDNNSNCRTFLLSWRNSAEKWLLSEDLDAAKDAEEAAM